jgi:DNA modification methylase
MSKKMPGVPKELQKLATPLDDLTVDPNNARIHDERNVEAVRLSLERFGWRGLIVAREIDGTVLAGNCRIEAARQLGWTHAPVLFVEGTDAEIRAYAITDNRTAELAGWDMAVLVKQLDELADYDDLFATTGFTTSEFDQLTSSMKEPGTGGNFGDEDSDEPPTPAPPKKAKTLIGQVITLGEHRIICGDSRAPEVWDALMEGVQVDAVLTDPPYGIEYVGKTKDALTIDNDDAAGLPALLEGAFANVIANTRPGAVWYVTAPSGPVVHDFGHALLELGVWRQTIIWVKNTLVLGHSDYHYQHEQIFYGWTPGADRTKPRDRKQTTVWQHSKPSRSADHPTMKPIDLFVKMLENSTRKGNTIVDPFLGSGTTLLAAEQLGRTCYGIEFSPNYCDVVVRRWEEMTGKKAKRTRKAR